ncbi:MAG: hypothetical protein LBQ48_06065, partial [Oscillospiraceae bacterium]|nr:hypothetical protein [Oscillospiraceae bacterium]
IESPATVRYHFLQFDVAVDYHDGPAVVPGREKLITLIVTDNGKNQIQNWISLKWYAPDGTEIKPGNTCSFFLRTTYRNRYTMRFSVLPPPDMGTKLELLADFTLNGRQAGGTVKVVLIPQLGLEE